MEDKNYETPCPECNTNETAEPKQELPVEEVKQEPVSPVEKVKQAQETSAEKVNRESTPTANYGYYYSAPNNDSQNNGQSSAYYYTQPEQSDPVYMVERQQTKGVDGFAIASFCVSMSFILLSCCCFTPAILIALFLILAAEVTAFVFALVSRKRAGHFHGLAIAGLVISCVIFACVFMFLMLAFLGLALSTSPEIYDILNGAIE